MAKNENKNIKKPPLEINVGDEIQLHSDVTVIQSDLSVAVPGPQGQKQELIFGEGWTSDSVTEFLREAIRIPFEDSEWPAFKGSVQQTIEMISDRGPGGTAKVPVPTGWLQHLGFPAEIVPEIKFDGGEKTTIRIITTLKPEGSSQDQEGGHI